MEARWQNNNTTTLQATIAIKVMNYSHKGAIMFYRDGGRLFVGGGGPKFFGVV